MSKLQRPLRGPGREHRPVPGLADLPWATRLRPLRALAFSLRDHKLPSRRANCHSSAIVRTYARLASYESARVSCNKSTITLGSLLHLVEFFLNTLDPVFDCIAALRRSDLLQHLIHRRDVCNL